MNGKVFFNYWLGCFFVRLAWRDYQGWAITPSVLFIWSGKLAYSPIRISWLGLTFTAYVT